jgi:hypothetical protein
MTIELAIQGSLNKLVNGTPEARFFLSFSFKTLPLAVMVNSAFIPRSP